MFGGKRDGEKGGDAGDDQHLASSGIDLPIGSGTLGRLPFEQIPMTDLAPISNAHDCVRRHPGLMRQEGDQDQGSQNLVRRALPAAHGALRAPRQSIQHGGNRRNGYG